MAQVTKQARTYFKLPPELGDGQHYSICDTDKRGVELLLEHIRTWAEEMRRCPGESFELEVIALTDEELEALPEI